MRGDTETLSMEDPLRQVIDLIPALAWSCRPDGTADFFNRVWLDYTGLATEHAVDWGWTAAIHPDDFDRMVGYWHSILPSGEPGEIEARLRRFDGEYRWFLFRAKPLVDESGVVVKWYGTNTDIHDRKLAEEALRESERNFRLTVDTIPAQVCTMTAAGELEVVNQQILDYFGKTRDALKDWSSIGAVHEDDVEEVVAKWRYSTETGHPYDVEHRIRRADGTYHWFHVRGLPLRDMQGRIVRWYILLVDIDDRKKAQTALQESERELRQTRRRLSAATQIATVAELSASIAHEINQPLASVVANAHACSAWLTSDPPNLDRALLTVERIIRDGNGAAEVVRRTRALFKQAAPAMARSNINELVVEVLELMADEIRESNIQVQSDLESGLPMTVVDRVQIQQTLTNLVHNAIEAMEGMARDRKTLLIISRREDADIVVRVRDNGCGIENPTSIFDPFYTTKEKGMGMGLAICRSIIELHGGRLSATPNQGAGTTFTFTLPLHREVSG